MMPPTSSPGGLLRSQAIRLVAGSGLGLATGFAGLFFGSLTIFLKPISHDFGWTRAETSAAVIMSMLGLAIGSPLQGRMIDRFGARKVIGVSVCAFAASLVALAVMPNSHLLFALGCFAVGMLAVGTGPNGYLSLLPHHFDRRLGTALSCAMIGVGAGTVVFAPLAQILVIDEGWRVAYFGVAAIALVGGLTALGMIGGPSGRVPQVAQSPVAPATGPSLKAGLRDWRLIVLCAALALGGASGLGITFHTAAMLDDRGFAPAAIGAIVALSGVGVMLGRLAGGILMDFIPARVVGAITYLLGAIAAALLGLDLTRSGLATATGGFLLGFALGTEGDFAAFAIRRYFGMRAFATLYGCVFAAYSLGSVVGVILCGKAFDRFGDYRIASEVSIASFVLAAVLVMTLGPYRFANPRTTDDQDDLVIDQAPTHY